MGKKIAEHVYCYPRLHEYNIAIRYLVEKGVGQKYLTAPRVTKKTIDLGAKYSPDFVCAPFKIMLGSYIEALERGANLLVQTGGTCRLGYYGELHEQILRDLGYEFEMMNLTVPRYKNLIGFYFKCIKKFEPQANLLRVARHLPAIAGILFGIDKVDDYYRKNMGFEKEKGTFDKIRRQFLADMNKAASFKDVRGGYKKAMRAMKAVPLDKPKHPIRIGVVGEYFTIMDPDVNHEIEKKLAMMGAEVYRWMNFTNSLLKSPVRNPVGKILSYVHYDFNKFPSNLWSKYQVRDCGKYAKYDMGSSSISTVAMGLAYAKAGFDGVVHVKSFGCTPEMDAVPVLHSISEDYRVPMLFLGYDTQTSETGIETRLEAFYDMIARKRDV